MSQKLVLPFTRCMMLCGYKNAEYTKYWGYPHYGIDVSTIQGGASDDPTVRASGEGEVLAAGKDSRLGYGVAVLYRGAYNHKTGKAVDVVGRYMHLKSVSVKAGDLVKAGTPLGVEGKEGAADYHLHLEFDTDITPAYATWTPQVAGTGGFWKKGVDSTVNPSYILYIGASQSLVAPTYNPAWLNNEDFNIPKLSNEDKDCENCKKLEEQLNILEEKYQNIEKKLQEIKDIINN